MSAAIRLLDRLEGVRATVKGRWIARCPAHDDRRPSLSICETDDRVLLHCWAGCEAADIVAAVGLRLADLFDKPLPSADPIPRHARIDWRDAWRCMWHEALLVSLVAADCARAGALPPEDAERAALAAYRLADAACTLNVGCPMFADDMTLEERMEAATRRNEAEAAEWPEPEGLLRPLPEADPYPLGALGPILGPAAQAMSATIQAPDAIIGGSLLAAASVAVMPHFDAEVDGRLHPSSLWVLTIASSGERKSAVDSEAVREHVAVEREASRAYKADLADHERRVAEHTAKMKKANAEAEPAPAPPLEPWIMAREPTVEGIHKAMARGRGFLGLMSDDAGDFLGGHAMGKDHRKRTVAALSSLWDKGAFDRVRGGDGASKYWGRRLSMHLMIQPVIAEGVLSDRVMSGQGFLARGLLAWPGERAGTRRYVERDLTRDPALQAYWGTMRELLTAKPRTTLGEDNELDPVPLSMDRKAKELWIEIANSFEFQQREGGKLHSIRPWASKAAEQVLRVAVVLTVVENARPTHLDAETINRAAEIVAFHLGETLRVLGSSSVPPHIRHAEAIREWLRQSGRREVHSGEILRLGPGCVRDAEALRRAMVALEQAGWVRPLPTGTAVDGKKRKSAWEVWHEAG